MKKTIKLLTMAAIIAALAFTAAGCPSGATSSPVSPLEGTWVNTYSVKFIFSGSNFTHQYSSDSGVTWVYMRKGTFSLSGDKLTFNYTHSWDGNAWSPDISTITHTISITAASFTIESSGTNFTFIKQ